MDSLCYYDGGGQAGMLGRKGKVPPKKTLAECKEERKGGDKTKGVK